MTRFVFLSALALLAACGTPQERCIAGATRDLRVVDQLILQTQGNLDRGYALVDVPRSTQSWVVCIPGQPGSPTQPARPPQMCLKEHSYTVTEPQAVNLADERVTLAELKKKSVALQKASAPAIASCRLAHPE